jgi:hypothetical protein
MLTRPFLFNPNHILPSRNTCMSHIPNLQYIAPLLHMITPPKQNINLLQTDLLRLGNKEINKTRQQEIDAREHVESVEAAVVEEDGEELLDDCVGDILRLGGHADGLGADVHGEDFGGPDPDGGAPGGFIWELLAWERQQV